MSNAVINAHIQMGEPCGPNATLDEIADWAGGLIMDYDCPFCAEWPVRGRWVKFSDRFPEDGDPVVMRGPYGRMVSAIGEEDTEFYHGMAAAGADEGVYEDLELIRDGWEWLEIQEGGGPDAL